MVSAGVLAGLFYLLIRVPLGDRFDGLWRLCVRLAVFGKLLSLFLT